MSVKKIISHLKFYPLEKEVDFIKTETEKLSKLIKLSLGKNKLKAEVFIGGSFAKNSFVSSNNYDIDIFVRFDKKHKNISESLDKALAQIKNKTKITFRKVHGSRDYYIGKKSGLIFEIIPVLKINSPSHAKNVTDLSYFHVNYIKKYLNKKIKEEIIAAKQFCKAQNVYGAESYINGFSGYAIECLIIYYKTFEKMLKDLVKVKDKKIIDLEKHYKNKHELLINMNENKMQSPIILIDPTFRERNVLAALNEETFRKFQEAAKKFLHSPSEDFFIEKKFSKEKIKTPKNSEFIQIKIQTNRQEGDVAGTKMKKFSKFLEKEISKCFEILQSRFEYNEGKIADFYLVLKNKKELIKRGPPIKMFDQAKAFRKKNKNVFEKNKTLYSKIKINSSARQFIENLMKKNQQKISSMGITDLKLIEND